MRIPERVVQEILQRARIEDIVGEYVQLTPKGDRLWGLSPFKTEKTPSFTVSPDKGAYYCFSTQKGGGVVNFVMEMEQMSYPEALTHLAKKLGIDVSSEDGAVSEEFKHKKALAELYQRLTATFHHLLLNSEKGKPALDYLLGRGLDLPAIEKFQLGYAPDDHFWLFGFLRSKNYSPDFLKASGLFGGKSKDWCIFAGRAMFPIANLAGETVAFGGRLLAGDGPKYINSPETALYHKGQIVYAIHHAREAIKAAGSAIICEGYMDVIALHMAGVANAVAPLGTAFTPEQALLLKRLAPDLDLLFDGDDAGVRATMRTLGVATKANMNLNVIQVPAGMKDPADILKERGSHELKKTVDCKLDAYNYLLRQVRDQGGAIHSLGGKEKAIGLFLPFWEAIEDESKLLDALDRFSNEIDLDRQAFRKDILRRLRRDGGAASADQKTSNPVRKQTESATHSMLDVRIMLATFIQGELFPFVRSSIALEDLRHPWAQELYIALEEAFRNQEKDIGRRVERVANAELRSLVQEKMVSGEFGDNPEAFVKDGIRRIRERNLTVRRDELNYQLRRLLLDPLRDGASERQLLEERMIIDEALKELRKQ